MPADWPVFQTVLPHAQALLDHTDTEPLCILADHLGRYVLGQGNTGTAIALSTRATHGLEQLHGPDHPDTLASRNNLANAYWSAGDVGRANPLYKATLADAERVLGPDRSLTKTIRSNIVTPTSDHD